MNAFREKYLHKFSSKHKEAFTIIEMMVSMSVLIVIFLLVAQATSSTGKLWRATEEKIKAFQNARLAFESMGQTISQATLNTYYEYYDQSGNRYTGQANFEPSSNDRYSELQFVSGPSSRLLTGISRNDATGSSAYSQVAPFHSVFFQAPLGYTLQANAGDRDLESTLNATGFFVEFGSDKDLIPSIVSSQTKPKYRYRLVQFIQPTEDLKIYTENWNGHLSGSPSNWYARPLSLPVRVSSGSRPTQILAENIIGLIIRPKRSDKEYSQANPKPIPVAPNYVYDSRPAAIIKPSDVHLYPTRYQLPPIISITVVAIDEPSAQQWEDRYGNEPPLAALNLSNLFQTTADTNVSSDYERDMDTLEKVLTAEGINYRIFTTEILINGSKWSQN